ncbi:MAG TPA: glycosyltransferase [Vicinamibacterales bacterium]|nr:glycosyltransferase [Vicinamibacterales bacterium]
MRVLLSTIGSRGDVQPLVALASELTALGQEVRLCVPPDFREWIEGLGMAVTTIGPELRPLTAASPSATPTALSPGRRQELAEATVAAQFAVVADAAQGCHVIVAATALQIAARSVAEQLGIPYVFASYCPAVLPSPHHAPPALPPIPGRASLPPGADNGELWARDAERFNSLFGPALNAHRRLMGQAPVDDVRSHVFTDQPWLAADRTLAPWPQPDDAAVWQTGAWIARDERALSSELQAFLDGGDPPIYFGFGSMRAPRDLGQVMTSAARTLGRRAIISRGWADLSPADSEPDCLVIGEVNQQRLFTRVAAVVHHGGAGTTTAAALAGAPQVVVPQLYDQHYWAQRVHDLGLGAAHAPGTPTRASLITALARALQPEVATRARAIAVTMDAGGARTAAVRLIDDWSRRS